MNAVVESFDSAVYARLLAETLPVFVTNEADYERMLANVERLIDKSLRNEADGLTPEEDRLLDLLSALIEAYEKDHHPIPDAEPHRVLQYLMRERNLQQRDLYPMLGSSGVTSEVVNGKRKPSKAQAEALARFFGVSPRLFRPPDV